MCLEIYLKLIIYVLAFAVNEDKPKLVSSNWIDPRPSGMEDGILTVDNLEQVRTF